MPAWMKNEITKNPETYAMFHMYEAIIIIIIKILMQILWPPTA